MSVNGLTIPEIADQLGITPSAAKFRLIRAGIQPKAQTGRMNFYDEDVVEQIREVSKGGRPKKKRD
jgi:predicted ArsR family transcriptional regulator